MDAERKATEAIRISKKSCKDGVANTFGSLHLKTCYRINLLKVLLFIFFVDILLGDTSKQQVGHIA
jgi:hypothetical protein